MLFMKLSPMVIYKKLITVLSDMKLSRKLIFSYIMILAIPISALGFYYFSRISHSIENDGWARCRQEVAKVKSGIQRAMDICHKSAIYVYMNREFRDFVGRDFESPVEDWIAFDRNVLRNIRNIPVLNPDILDVRFFVANPNFNGKVDIVFSQSVLSGEAWWEELVKKQGRFYWRLNHPYKDYNRNVEVRTQEVVSLYYQFDYLNDDRYLGVLEVNMPVDRFLNDFFAGGEMDADSFRILARTDDAVFIQNNSPYFEKTGVNPQEVKALFLSCTRGEEGSFQAVVGHDKLLVAYQYIGGTFDAYIYQATSIQSLTNDIVKSRNLIFLGILLSIGVLSAITVLATSILLKKMKVIVASMRKVQEGDMFIRIPLQGKDEIGELAGHFQTMLDKINELIFTVVRKEAATRESEIRALQSQINAHFMYNVLEAIKSQAEINFDYATADSVAALGRLLRYSMNWSRKYVTLKEELANAKDYITLMNLRYNQRISVEMDIQEELMGMEVLKMTVQPIVENSINHGLKLSRNMGLLRIEVRGEVDRVVIDIFDNGVGMSEEELEALRLKINGEAVSPEVAETKVKGSGIGLRNIHERLKLFYGQEFGLSIDSRKGGFTRVQLKLPYRR